MPDISLTGLVNSFASQWAAESNFVGVTVVNGDASPEVIINSKENFDSKLLYWKNAYDESLHLKSAPHIKIVGWAFGNSFAEIQEELNISGVN